MRTEHDHACWLERQGLDGAATGLSDAGEPHAEQVERLAAELIDAAGTAKLDGETRDRVAKEVMSEVAYSYGLFGFADDDDGPATYELGNSVLDKLTEIRDTLASDGPLTLDYARDCLAWIARQAGDDEARGQIENQMGRETYTLPAYWASALINGDESGLGAEERDALHRWLAWFEEGRPGWHAADVGESYFSNYHEATEFTGYLAGDVADFTFIGKPVN